MEWNKFVSQKLINEGYFEVDPENDIGFSYLKIADSEEVFGLVGMGKASIYKDVVEKNGLMWFEIVEIQKDVLKKTRYVESEKILVNYDVLGKRVSRAIIRFLKNKDVAVISRSMRFGEYREFSTQCELWVQEIRF